MIINAWQHIKDQGKKLMGFEMMKERDIEQ